MFAQAASTLPQPASPNSPSGHSRPSRLRGLSYLRNYAQNHSTSHNSNSQSGSPSSPGAGGLVRFISSPASANQTQLSESGRSYFEGPETSEEGSSSMARRPRAGPQAAHTTQDGRRAPSAALTPLHNAIAIPPAPPAMDPAAADSSGLAGLPPDQMPTIRFLPYQDPRSHKPSLAFSPTSRTLPHEDCVIRVGRYSERDLNANPPPNIPSSAPVGFKSKVVSRRHCEFWCSQGQWYIKDVKSSSGTFLNHIRLSQPSVESNPFPVNDGDVVQLGIDFRGGEEQIFRCVKIRIECNRAWQKALNSFNMSTHKQLRALGATKKEADNNSTHSTECSICLMSIAPCQSLFVAPCSHVWHFRCIRPILLDSKNFPQFLCPNCRAVADLEAEIDDPAGAWNEAANSSTSDLGHNDAANATEDDAIAQAIAASLEANAQNSGATSPSAFQIEYVVAPAELSAQSSRPNLMPVVRGRDHITIPESLPSPAFTSSIGIAVPLANEATPDQQEGPLTPRNDAGPFVFDGSAGRATNDTASSSA